MYSSEYHSHYLTEHCEEVRAKVAVAERSVRLPLERVSLAVDGRRSCNVARRLRRRGQPVRHHGGEGKRGEGGLEDRRSDDQGNGVSGKPGDQEFLL